MAKTTAIKKSRKYTTPGKLVNMFARSADDKIEMIRKGISKNDLVDIKEKLDIDYESLSKLLAISRASILKKKSTEKFDQPTSERIMQLADLVGYGNKVFSDENKFREWLNTPNIALGKKAPIDMMDTTYGIRELNALLGRIEFGIY
jgi:putative toxin-antitoxin system antitoxin component (TIGR02293 family)